MPEENTQGQVAEEAVAPTEAQTDGTPVVDETSTAPATEAPVAEEAEAPSAEAPADNA